MTIHHSNLLPWEFRRRLLVTRRLKQWAAVWCLVAIAGGGAAWRESAQLSDDRQTLAMLEQRAVPLHAMLVQNRELVGRLELSASRQELLATLRNAESPLQVLGVLSRGIRDHAGGLQIRSFALTTLETGLPAAGPQTPGPDGTPPVVRQPRLRLGLDGIAADDVVLSEFITELRQTGFFEEVQLRGSNNHQLATGTARQYSVECVF